MSGLPESGHGWRFMSTRSNNRKVYPETICANSCAETSRCLQNTGGSRMRPVAKYMATSRAIHRNQIKAASKNATMNPPINAWSCVRRSRHHRNLLGIYSPSAASALRRVHWSKEASRLGFTFPFTVGSRIINTMMEAIIRRWCPSLTTNQNQLCPAAAAKRGVSFGEQRSSNPIARLAGGRSCVSCH